MSKDLDITISKGNFRKIREWNRRKNYYLKGVKLNIKIYVAKLIWDKRKKSTFDLASIKTILLLRNEGTIGDMVVYSTLVKSLYESGYTVDLLLTKASSTVMKYNPYVRNIYEAGDANNTVYLKDFNHTLSESTIKSLNENNYDLIIDPSLFDTPVHRMKLLREINAKSVLGFNKWRNINHYSKSLYFKSGKEHVTVAVGLIADCMKVNAINVHPYDLHLPDSIVDEVKDYLNSLSGSKKVIINIFTGSTERNFSQGQLAEIIDNINQEYSNIDIILLDHRKEINIPLPANVVINPFDSLHHVMALVRETDLIISPDTSIVHISAAWEKMLVSVYKNVFDNNDLWAPGYQRASQIIVQHRKISDVDHIPASILQEIKKRDLLAHKQVNEAVQA